MKKARAYIRSFSDWQEDTKKVSQVLGRVRKVNDRAAAKALSHRLGWGRAGECVLKYGGLSSEESAVNAESDVAGDEDDGPVVEPKLLIADEGRCGASV